MKTGAKVLAILGGTAALTAIAALVFKPNEVSAAPAGGEVTLTGVTVSASTPSVAVGASLSLSATAFYSDGSTEDVTDSAIWATSNPAIATIQGQGSISGVAPGTVNIGADYLGIIGQISVSVTPA